MNNFSATCGQDPPRGEAFSREVVILGGGLAGLAAGYVLAEAGRELIVFEGAPAVGGLSKTVTHGDFHFDIGGHRFITKSKRVEEFVARLMQGEFLEVPRKSKIYMLDRYFDYPLGPANAVFGLGLLTTFLILADYAKERVRRTLRPTALVSLEDWVVSRFGRKMFDLYFREYSEKVWGIDCREISMEWVAQRIQGLSLWTAIKNGFCKLSGRDVLTLADSFYYPPQGIGQISERLQARISTSHPVCTNTRVVRLEHRDGELTTVVAANCERQYTVRGRHVISSIPLPALVQMLQPGPPQDILDAAAELRYRDLVIVTVMLDRERVTDLTWMYLPEQEVPFGRIHEPKNWSPFMAPAGKSHIVAEYFCFRGDGIWGAGDDELTRLTVHHLERLGFIDSSEVIDSCVLRKPNAYPILAVGYQEHYRKILDYLSRFSNLHIAGRSGMFRYYNMDHAMESGIEAAETVMSDGGARG